jgi:hypothetical protein
MANPNKMGMKEKERFVSRRNRYTGRVPISEDMEKILEEVASGGITAKQGLSALRKLEENRGPD